MLKFIVNNTKLGDSVLPISWCVSQEELDEIESKGILNPYMLILVAEKYKVYGSDENDPTYQYMVVDHKLVKLESALAYINFHKAGPHAIFGAIVGAKDHKFKTLWNNVSDTHNVCVHRHGEFEIYDFNVPNVGRAELETEVSAEFFAPEPPAWQKEWVNLWFHDRPRDQCQYRKRKIFAFTLKPFLYAMYFTICSLVAILFVTTAALLGLRKANYKILLHPTWKVYFVLEPGRLDSVFFFDEEEKFRIAAFPFLPLFFLTSLFVASFTKITYEDGHSNVLPVLSLNNILVGVEWYAIFLGLYFGILTAIFLAIGLFPAIGKVLTKLFTTPEPSLDAQMSKQSLSLDFLTCDKRLTLDPGLSSVPKQNRTIYLWYQDTKSRVCKPFQT